MSDALDLARAAEEGGDALIDREGALSFRELHARARDQLARWPALRPGDRVLITPRVDRESVVSIAALLEARATIVLAHPRWSAAERDRVIARARPRLVIDERAYGRDAEPIESTAGGVIVFTSGTSGEPKGVCLSRAALIASAHAHSAALPWREDDRWLLAMPLAHVGGLGVVVRCLVARRAIALGPSSFDPGALLAEARDHAATLVSLVPTMLARILPSPPPPSVRAVLLGGAACPSELLARGRAAGWPLLPTYGLSECCAQVCTQRLDATRARGVGPPLPGVELRIERGGIEVRGPTRMDGYLGEPPLAPDAWLRTGDLGAIDEEGHLHVLGREDDRIVSGGENVDPLAVEEALALHPAVESACVVGIPDPEWGERVCAFVVSADPSPAVIASLRAHLTERVASFAVPKEWRFVEAQPLLANGKVDRRALRARCGER